jgi:hypothetical protein
LARLLLYVESAGEALEERAKASALADDSSMMMKKRR